MEPEGPLPRSKEPANGPYQQTDLVHTFPVYYPNIHSNIILPPTPRYSEWSLPLEFSNQNFVCISHLSRACYMPRAAHPPRFDRTNTW
jgi:hypothetical protein